ncbi:L-lactate dehydrogenase (cytochrome) [Paucibacter oligotrophus]|uniref:L-lactate dehydrogenase (Cytochrome) n=1 Tax=Roseateles oligotrophus TaxID=1769250 RepID=A0A840LA78_9BURK|nr:L-lactate dehydrogenase [Roseateles oligotrophus]MBB4843675.1 L-lactate dehydrogenase (cytochrome) [Roseateles oligotrophus]
MSKPLVPASFEDWRTIAKARVPSFLFGFVDGGSFDEDTLRENVAAWRRVRLRQYVLRDVSATDIGTRFFGRPATMPLALAPVGLGGSLGRRGEVQAARAAAAFGVPFTLCTPAICSIEEVRAATSTPFWFQLYMLRDRGIVRELLQRARAAQCSALVFTVDLARVSIRRSDIRHGMTSAPSTRTALARVKAVLARPNWLWNVALKGGPLVFGNLKEYVPKATRLEDFKAWVDAQFDPSVNWQDIEWLRTQWDGPIILKGLLEAEDARLAADIGVQGFVVSNHGGRQLDGTAPTAEALPRLAGAVAGRGLTVLVDGGIRCGHDLIKARALGADGVLAGRPWAYAMAAGGEAGVHQWLTHMEAELRNTLGLMGQTRLADVGPDQLLP